MAIREREREREEREREMRERERERERESKEIINKQKGLKRRKRYIPKSIFKKKEQKKKKKSSLQCQRVLSAKCSVWMVFNVVQEPKGRKVWCLELCLTCHILAWSEDQSLACSSFISEAVIVERTNVPFGNKSRQAFSLWAGCR